MKARVVAVVPARLDSSRLPGKHLLEVSSYKLIEILIQRIENIEAIDEVVIATTNRQCDKALVNYAKTKNINYFCGAVNDVLSRFVSIANKYKADLIIRANGDNPLLSPEVIQKGLQILNNKELEFVTGKSQYTGLPIGIGPEILSSKVLMTLDRNACKPNYREHVTTFIFDNPKMFRWGPIPVKKEWEAPEIRLTVDTMQDLENIRRLVNYLRGLPQEWSIEEIISTYRKNM